MSQDGFIKTACQACEGRLELPLEAVGVPFACPRCGTKLELAFKCACEHCGGPLSFPANAVGHHIDCGHCHGNTLLMPSAIRVVGEPASEETHAAPEPVAEAPAPAAPATEKPGPDPAVTMDLSHAVRPRAASPAAAETRVAPPGRPVRESAPPKRPNPQAASGLPAPSRPAAAPARPGGPPRSQGVKGPPGAAAAKSSESSAEKPDAEKSSEESEDKKLEGNAAPPKRPSSAAPQKKGVMSPSDAAAARMAAGGIKAAPTSSQVAEAAAMESAGRMEGFKKKGAVVLVAVVVLGMLTWFVALPLLDKGGDATLLWLAGIMPKPKVSSGIPVVAKVNPDDIEVDEASLAIKTGDAGLPAITGKVKNSGKQNLRDVKITFQVATASAEGDAKPGECSVNIPKLAAGAEKSFEEAITLTVAADAKPTVKGKTARIDEPAPSK